MASATQKKMAELHKTPYALRQVPGGKVLAHASLYFRDMIARPMRETSRNALPDNKSPTVMVGPQSTRREAAAPAALTGRATG